MLSTITTHGTKKDYLRRVADNTYADDNKVYLVAKRDHATFVVYNRFTGRTVNRVRVADMPTLKDGEIVNGYDKSFCESLAWAIDNHEAIPKLNQHHQNDGTTLFEWAFYDNYGQRITLCPLFQFKG